MVLHFPETTSIIQIHVVVQAALLLKASTNWSKRKALKSGAKKWSSELRLHRSMRLSIVDLRPQLSEMLPRKEAGSTMDGTILNRENWLGQEACMPCGQVRNSEALVPQTLIEHL